MTREGDFLDWLRQTIPPRSGVETGVGPDDCAVVRIGERRLLLTTDTIVEGTHFPSDAPPEAVGHKAVAASLSDLAASGGRPLWGLVAATLRRGRGLAWAQAVTAGLTQTAAEFGLAIVGGDTTSCDGPASITVTCIGETLPGGPLLRSGARPGDVLLVTGPLGGSLLGKHLSFRPRLREIEAILQQVPVNACMDITDGLSIDLHRMLRESGCGARIEEAMIPVSEAARAMAEQDRQSALQHALSDGEDFELLLAIAPENCTKLQKALENGAVFPQNALALTPIGVVETVRGLRLSRSDGAVAELSPEGYEHAL